MCVTWAVGHKSVKSTFQGDDILEQGLFNGDSYFSMFHEAGFKVSDVPRSVLVITLITPLLRVKLLIKCGN